MIGFNKNVNTGIKLYATPTAVALIPSCLAIIGMKGSTAAKPVKQIQNQLCYFNLSNYLYKKLKRYLYETYAYRKIMQF